MYMQAAPTLFPPPPKLKNQSGKSLKDNIS
jgi:hypothetical protein